MHFEIRQCTVEDAEDYAKHSLLHLTEKGIDDIYVHPFSSTYKRSYDEQLANLLIRWSSDPFSPNWEIAWKAVVSGKIIGHLCLRSGGIPSAVHRMRLGMGIEHPYRSCGIGQELLKASMNWVRTQDAVHWIDLSVFSNNVVARKLYQKHGFVELYTVKDAFRVDDIVIDDIQMVFKNMTLRDHEMS